MSCSGISDAECKCAGPVNAHLAEHIATSLILHGHLEHVAAVRMPSGRCGRAPASDAPNITPDPHVPRLAQQFYNATL